MGLTASKAAECELSKTTIVSMLAGSDTRGFRDGVGGNAQFFHPMGVVLDGEGNTIVADSANHRIRKVTPDGVVSTLAGSGRGFRDGARDSARFNYPYGLALDGEGLCGLALERARGFGEFGRRNPARRRAGRAVGRAVHVSRRRLQLRRSRMDLRTRENEH